jgi:glucose/arabinose dehydrogenase
MRGTDTPTTSRLTRALLFVAALAVLAPTLAYAADPTCGVPVSGGASPNTSDALFILRVAVGSERCRQCVCDTEGSGDVSAADALIALKASAGQSVTLECPVCDPSTTTTTLCPQEAPEVPPLEIDAVNATAAEFATYALQPPGSSDWYLVEQAGRIRIVRNGELLATPFLDISAAIGTGLGERGLLSVAFHPGYAQNGRFFTMATPGDGADGTYAPSSADAVVEWRRSTDPDQADAVKVRDIVVLPASATNHNGGTALFGPDGFLYVGTGDGGGGCESNQRAATQDTAKLFGKILRLDVDAAPPFAAAGNPFAEDARVYHYGLRNPFRFSIDAPTSDLFVGDVGQSSFEEISVAAGNAPGKNFGWPAFEGLEDTCGGKALAGPSPHTPPIVSVDRRSGSNSPFRDYAAITGGRVYHGSAIPGMRGVYLFADFYGAELGALRFCNGQVFGPVAVPLSEIPVSDGELSGISSFAQGNDGELYVTYGSSTRIGRIAPRTE